MGDVITRIDGKPVRDVRAVKNRIGLVMLGQRLEMEIVRDGKDISITAIIEELLMGSEVLDGVEFAQLLSQNGRPYLIIESIVPGAPMDEAGLQAGDIILSVNQHLVGSLNSIKLRTAQELGPFLFEVQRGDTVDYVELN